MHTEREMIHEARKADQLAAMNGKGQLMSQILFELEALADGSNGFSIDFKDDKDMFQDTIDNMGIGKIGSVEETIVHASTNNLSGSTSVYGSKSLKPIEGLQVSQALFALQSGLWECSPGIMARSGVSTIFFKPSASSSLVVRASYGSFLEPALLDANDNDQYSLEQAIKSPTNEQRIAYVASEIKSDPYQVQWSGNRFGLEIILADKVKIKDWSGKPVLPILNEFILHDGDLVSLKEEV